MELVKFSSRGGFSLRSILTFVLAVFATVILWTVMAGAPAHAEDATWNGAALTYGGQQYTSMGEMKETGTEGIAQGTSYYLRVDTPTGQSPSQGLQKAYVIYFAPGVSPPTATEATYAVYDYSPSTKKLSNPSSVKTITVDAESANDSSTSCAIEGVGWIVCPLMGFLSWGMDWVFIALSGFMEVQPLESGNTQSGLYNTWNIARSVANVAFIIVFLIIIYSQLTNIQVSNYGLKKLLPRLIIAAIAVNLSFTICAVAVDISNILGYSIQDLFDTLRDQILSTQSEASASLLNWQSITGFVLSGGTAALAAGIGIGTAIAATGGVGAAAVFLLLPALVGLLLAVLVVLLILAARQALIVILVIIAPLAIVAYLLPNTEKWFGKWRDLFMTMLIFFPAFSVVFGGSQLASAIIIQNATSINMLILGMIVQVAPLVIAPLLLRLSGNVLGGIAKIVNNPNKGLVDRTRNWSKDRAEWHRKRGVGNLDRNGNPMDRATRNPFRISAQKMDQRKQRLGDRTANADVAGKTAYENSKYYAARPNRKGDVKYDMALQKARFEDDKNATHSHHATKVDEARLREGSLVYQSGLNAQAQKDSAEGAQNNTTAYYNRIRSSKQFATRVGGSALFDSNYGLEVTKTRLEVSQTQLQTFMDTERARPTSVLNTSTIELENSKSIGEKAKAELTTYLVNERTSQNGSLRLTSIEAEQAKQVQQISDAQLTTMVENLKSGKIDPTTLSAREQVIMDAMKADSVLLSAQKQAGVSAQYEVQRNIADVMTGSGPLTDQMLDIAQGVGGETARFRAQAQAVKAARSLDSEALGTNVELLKNQAQREGTNIKRYSAGLLDAVLKGLPMYEGTHITPEMTKAAMQAQADEKNISLFEKIRGSDRFDQAMVSEIISLNNTNFKIAGGFGLQDDPTLNIANPAYNTAGKFEHALRLQRISNLANTNASGLSGLKFGWVVGLADKDELEANIRASLIEAKRGDKPNATKADKDAAATAKANLEAAYKTVRNALLNDDIRDTITDRETFIRTIEAELARVHGQEPVPSEPLTLQVDADNYRNDTTS